MILIKKKLLKINREKLVDIAENFLDFNKQQKR